MASVSESTRIVPPGVRTTPSEDFKEGEVRLLADREHAGVGGDRHQIALVVTRREPAVLIEDGHDLLQLDRLEPPRPEETVGTPPRQEGNAFLLRLFELLVPLRRSQNRHLLETLERHDRDFRCPAAQSDARGVEGLLHAGVPFRGRFQGVDLIFPTQAQRRPRGVEGDESAADHHDAAAEVHPKPPVDVQEVVDRLHDAVLLDARYLKVSPARDADREEEGFEALTAQLRKAEARRERATELQLDAERHDLVDLGADERAWKAVLGDRRTASCRPAPPRPRIP